MTFRQYLNIINFDINFDDIKILNLNIEFHERGSVGWISLDQNCHFTVDPEFHLQ